MNNKQFSLLCDLMVAYAEYIDEVKNDKSTASTRIPYAGRLDEVREKAHRALVDEPSTKPEEPVTRLTYEEWHERVGRFYTDESGSQLLICPDRIKMREEIRTLQYQRARVLEFCRFNLTDMRLQIIESLSTQIPPPIQP